MIKWKKNMFKYIFLTWTESNFKEKYIFMCKDFIVVYWKCEIFLFCYLITYHC